MTISAVLNVYDELKDAERCIMSYKAHYPAGDIIVAGSEIAILNELAEKFQVETVLTRQYISVLHKIESSDFLVSKQDKISCIRVQLENLRLAFERVRTEYSFYLHPDHLVKRKIRKFQLGLDLEILESNRIKSQIFFDIQKLFPNAQFGGYWGIWGYFKVNSLIATIDFILSDSTILQEFIDIDDLFIYDDVLIPVVMQSLNFQVATRFVTSEIRRRTFILRKILRVLEHQVPKSSAI